MYLSTPSFITPVGCFQTLKSYGKKGAQQAFSVHQLIEKLDGNIIDILPAVHALTGTS